MGMPGAGVDPVQHRSNARFFAKRYTSASAKSRASNGRKSPTCSPTPM
jgi:hypothetical protein